MEFINSFKLILVFIFAVPLNAVTVNPALCPTNKIAPHRRIVNWDFEYRPRTFGAYYDLLAPGGGGGGPYRPPGSLQEEPQKDDPDDCGDIEDYDENDLSSLTPQTQRKFKQYSDSRFFFGLFNNGGQTPQAPNPGYPVRPTTNRPFRPQRPDRYPATRPPYWSGGPFGSNPYHPPVHQYPSEQRGSNSIKPVHDGVEEPQTTYRPGLVGGPVGHVVGVTPATTRAPLSDPVPQRAPSYPYRPKPVTDRIPQNAASYQYRPPVTQHSPYLPTEAPIAYPTRRPRPRKLNDSVFGSFIDLLF